MNDLTSTITAHDLESLIQRAWQRRGDFHEGLMGTDAYRIFHGYAEGLPGLSIDRYGSWAVVNKKLALSLSDQQLCALLLGIYAFKGIVLKTHQSVAINPESPRVHVLHGEAMLTDVVQEHSHKYFVDLGSLHSNGLYLDARPARRWLYAHSKERRVLNLFAHTGSLGLAATLGGAKEVVHVDKGREATSKIALNYQLNGRQVDERGIVRGDLYYHLPRAIQTGQSFDGIILDPPPKVPPPPRAPKHRPQGQDFDTLIQLCLKLLRPGSWLLCIYHDFRRSHFEHDQAIIAASKGRLYPVWQGRADEDVWEAEDDRWTRMSVFTLGDVDPR